MPSFLIRSVGLIVMAAFLTACSGSGGLHKRSTFGTKTLSKKKATSRAYQIKGIWYQPQHHFEYSEVGLASHYGSPKYGKGGDTFHGRKTSTGEIFDTNKLTAAHKTLPLPSVVWVTNLENGRRIKLKVNDRGPFVKGRIIDVSRKAANLLGFYGKGLAKVRVETDVPASLAMNRNPRQDMPTQLASVDPPYAQGHHKKAPPKNIQRALAGLPGGLSKASGPLMHIAQKPETRPLRRVWGEPAQKPAPQAPILQVRGVDLTRPLHVEPLASPKAPVHLTANPPLPQQRPNWLAIKELSKPPLSAPGTPMPTAPPFMDKALAASPVQEGGIFIQAGTFSQPSNAGKMYEILRQSQGSAPVHLNKVSVEAQKMYTVRLGPFKTSEAAQGLLNTIRRLGPTDARVIYE